MSAFVDGPLRWLDLDASETPAHPDLLRDLCARRLDGMTIHHVFTDVESARALPELERARNAEPTEAMFGTMLAMPLPDLLRAGYGAHESEVYFDAADRSRVACREAFGFDPDTRVVDVLTPMADGLAIRAPDEHGRRYNAGNVRWFEPGRGGLPAHAGNEFQMHTDAVFEHLRTTTRTTDHLSWFVVLQTPEVGGALTVYDLIFGEHAPQVEWGEHGRDDADFAGCEALRVAPPAGSMVIFGGGWRYHRVDPIEGTMPRVTYGGFAGPSTDGTALHLWF